MSALLALGLATAGAAAIPAAAHAAATTTTSSANTTHTPDGIGEQRALAQAKASGKPVQVTSATTASSTLIANPNGTLTLDQSLAPVRKKVGGRWQGLDAALTVNPHGGVSPKVSTSTLVLSDGGKGPLATMTSAGRSLSVSMPMSLPVPTLSGDTATYPGVLPGVDLEVTTDVQGGFREVLVVKNAAAAANPALKSLQLATRTNGVFVSADTAGNVTAKDRWGRPVFTAQAPQMWDSSTSSTVLKAAAVVNPMTGQKVDPRSGLPTASSVSGPGEGARQASIKVAASNAAIRLTPDASLLTSPSTVYPVYIDPSFTAPVANTPLQAWTQTNSYYSSSSYWKSSDLLRVGDQAWQSPYFVARSFVQIGIPSAIYGATVLSSRLNFTEEWSPSCTSTGVQLWQSGGINSSTTYNNPPALISQVGSTATVAHGYNSSCPAAAVGFDMSSVMSKAAAGHWSNATFGLVASNEGDPYGWKEFANTVTYSTTYDHAPNTPSTASMSTSPKTSCTGSTVGDGTVSLYAKLTDPDGGLIGATYSVVNHATGATLASSNPQNLYVSNGQTVVLQLSKSTLEAAAANKATQFDWKVQATDFYMNSGWSPTCSFTFDPTRAGAPTITPPGSTTACGTNPVTVGTIGQKATFNLSPTSGSPTAYVYQLNGGAPHTVSASSGPITVTPTRFTNELSVSSTTAGGNYGDTAVCVFNSATPSSPAAPDDMTGAGVADLVTVGGQNTLPAGLWLATGQAGPGHTGDGHINASATDIGMYGSGINANGGTGTGSPADFNGAIAFTGLFTRDNLQDVLVYYPSGAHAGTGEILPGNGDGSALDDTAAQNISSGAFLDNNTNPATGTGDNPIQLANADDITGDNTSTTPAYPDLIGISGDSTNGYALNIYGGSAVPGSYNAGQGGIGNSIQLTTTTPTGGTDWNNWTITTTQITSGTNAGIAMYLWNKSTGDLYLWTGLSYNTSSSALNFTQNKIASSWHTNTAETLQVADINGDGLPDLWSTDASGNTTADLVNTSLNGFTNTVTDTLVPLAHAWDLDDQTTGTVGTNAAADQTSTLSLSGNAGSGSGSPLPSWTTGSFFNPDVSLNTTTANTTSSLNTSGPAINVSGNFTVSVWAKPDLAGGVILSQDGAHSSGMILYPDTTTKQWYFCLATQDSTTWSYDCAHGGTPAIGAWAHLTASYNAATKNMALYVNGVPHGAVTHTPVSSSLFRGDFTVGDYLYNNARTSYFNGEVSQVQTWNSVLTPSQIAARGATGAVVFPSDSTTYPSGSKWALGATTISFNQGQLTVDSAGTPFWSAGKTGYPNAVLTQQTDGNLVIYDTAADAQLANGTGVVWASATAGHPGDMTVFQSDGNIVTYDADGLPIWATGTWFPDPGCDQWILSSTAAGADDAGSNPATVASSVTYATDHAGNADAASVFDGTDGIVRATAPGGDTTQSYTVSAWVKLNSATGAQIAVGQGTVNHQAFYLGYNASNGGWIFQTTTTDTASTTFPTAESPATPNVWTHLVGVYDSTTGAQQLYVNGALKASTTNTTPQYNPGGALTIGAIEGVGSSSPYDQFAGSISDVQFYPLPLTATQVQGLYTTP